MAEEESGIMSRLNQHITRRQAIKAGGIAAIGLAFSAPLIRTLQPRSAFAAGTYVATGPGPTNGGATGAPSLTVTAAPVTSGVGPTLQPGDPGFAVTAP